MLKLDWTHDDRELDCRVCGESSTGSLIAWIRGGEPDPIPVVRCPVCGSLELLDEPLDWSPNDEVVDDYAEAGAGIGTIVSFLQLADPEPVTRFLDVGCNYGFTVDYGAFRYGWQSVGVEPSRAGVRGAADLGVDIRVEYLTPQSRVGEDYDLVLSSEVVEHVPEPVGFLRAIRERLAPGGRVVLTTPDAATVDPALPETDAIHALSPGFHVFLASEDGLRLLLERAGFGAVALRSTGGTLYAVAAAEPGAPVAVADAPEADQFALEAYYFSRFGSAPAGSALSAGMAVRLLRSRVNRAAFDDIEADAERAVAAYGLRHGGDLADPQRTRAEIEAADAAPRVLPGAAYALGMLELLHRRRSEMALAYFELARSAAEIWIRTVGMPDLDIDDLLAQSTQLIEHSRAQLAADERDRAVQARIAAEQRVNAASQALAGRLAAGDTAADAERAELVAAYAAFAGLDLTEASAVAAAPATTPRLADVAFTLGMAELQRGVELARAAGLFDAAARAASADPAAAELARQATLTRVRTLARIDPAAAGSAALALLDAASAADRPELEVLLVRTSVDGVIGAGAVLDGEVRERVGELAPLLAADGALERVSTGLDGLLALGLDAVRRGDAEAARDWLGRCRAAIASAPEAPNGPGLAGMVDGALASLP